VVLRRVDMLRKANAETLVVVGSSVSRSKARAGSAKAVGGKTVKSHLSETASVYAHYYSLICETRDDLSRNDVGDAE